MRSKAPKTAVVAFKVEAELAEILNRLPNKSAFIRKAIMAQLSVACPLCRGAGYLPKGLHDHYAALLHQFNSRACDHCGSALPLPAEPGELPEHDRRRLEQFFYGGPFYCDTCYEQAPPCDDCGWHIAPEQLPQHRHESSD